MKVESRLLKWTECVPSMPSSIVAKKEVLQEANIATGVNVLAASELNPALTCNVTLKGVCEKTDSQVEHFESSRAAQFATHYPALTVNARFVTRYITQFCCKSVAAYKFEIKCIKKIVTHRIQEELKETQENLLV